MSDGQNRISRGLVLGVLLIFLFAVWIRVEYLHLAGGEFYLERDAKQYIVYAHNLVAHGVFSVDRGVDPPRPDSFRSPGYPLLIAAFLQLGGEERYLHYLVYTQAVMTATLSPLVFITGVAFMSPLFAFIAAVLTALCPHLVSISGYVLTEALLSFLLLAAVCCLQHAIQKADTVFHVLAAILFGGVVLTNEAYVMIPFFSAAVAWFLCLKGRKTVAGKKIIRDLLLFSLIVALFPIAWALRNHFTATEGVAKGSDRAVATLSHGAYPDFIYKNPFYRRFPYREDPQQPEFGSSLDQFLRILWSRAKAEPLRYIRWYLLGKPYYLWSWSIIQGVGDIYIYPVRVSLFQVSLIAGTIRAGMKLLHPLVLVLALLSLPAVYVQWRQAIPGGDRGIDSPLLPLSVCVYVTLLYMIFAPWPRYSIPVRPELYLCCVWTGFFCMNRMKDGKATEKA
ncbi:MAG: ArnT family glycosyltransferase [Thermodesulfobacteriota bacterium]